MRPALAVLGVAVLMTACSPPSDTASAPSTESTSAGPIREPAPSVATPLIADAVNQPVAVTATDGKTHLVYEITLTNTLSHELTLTSVTVLDRDVALLDLTGDRLNHWTRVLGSPTPTTRIGAAQTAAVWLDIALDAGAPPPTRLTHAVSLSNPDPRPPLFDATQTIDIAPVDVQMREPVVLDPPLAGPNWVDGGGCCDTSAHRTALNPINGRLWAAERFAIDYAQLDPGGRLASGDPAKLDSYAYFGADIRAAGDGLVIAVLDGLPEQTPGQNPTGLPLDQYAGNHVVQDLGDGSYALYAHLKTGSVKVKRGDRLTSGQVIGNVGNTGNSSAPHLHFHVMSSPDPLRSDGLPFVFTDFRVTGRITDAEALDTMFDGQPAPLQPDFAARGEHRVMPMELDVMTYGNR